jgi:hypothetical protein
VADDYRQRLTAALDDLDYSHDQQERRCIPVDDAVEAVLAARDQELAELRREVQRWRRRAGEAEGVVTRIRELLQGAGRLCTSCDRWHKDECWRLCPEDGARAERISRPNPSVDRPLLVAYECGHMFESRLRDADDYHARLRAPYASHLTLEAGQA